MEIEIGKTYAVDYFGSETLEVEVEDIDEATDTVRFKIIGSGSLHVVGSTVETTLAGFKARAYRAEPLDPLYKRAKP